MHTDLDGHSQPFYLVVREAEEDEDKMWDGIDQQIRADAGGPSDSEPEGPYMDLLLDDARVEP